MTKNYVTPSIEVIEIEIQDAVLELSSGKEIYSPAETLDPIKNGGGAW